MRNDNDIITIAIIVALAISGAVIRELRYVGKKKIRLATFLAGVPVAAILGLMVSFIMRWLGLDQNLACVVSVVVGYIGYPIFDTLTDAVHNKIKSYTKTEEKK